MTFSGQTPFPNLAARLVQAAVLPRHIFIIETLNDF